MSGSAVLAVRIVSDSRDAQRGFDETDRSAQRSAGRVQGHFKSAAAGMAKAFAGLAVVDFLKDSAGAYVEAEEGQAKYLDAMGRVPGISDAATAALTSQAEALALKTKFDDDATKSGQAVLAGFKLTADQISKLTPLVQDYAERTGKDMPTAARDLGKALNGQTGPLKKIGIDIKSTGDRAKDFTQLTGALNDKIGGLAQTAGGTAAGKVAILKNQFGEVQETVGSFLVPLLVMLGAVLLKVVGFVQRNINVLAPLAAAIAAVVAVVKVYTVVQRILNFVMAANPILLIVLAIAALAAGLIYAYQKSETFREIVQAAFAAVMVAVQAVAGFFTTVLPNAFMAIVRGLHTAWDAVVAFIKTWGPRALIFLAPFIGIPLLIFRNFSKIVGWLQGVWNTVTGAVSSFVGTVVGYISDIPRRLGGLAGGMLSAGAALIGALFRGIGNAASSAGGFALDIAKTIVNTIVRGLNNILNLPLRLDFEIPLPFGRSFHVGPYTVLPSIPLWSTAADEVPTLPTLDNLMPGFTLMAAGSPSFGDSFGGGYSPPSPAGASTTVINNNYRVEVTGTVTDPDGAARAIGDLLNDHARRLGKPPPV